MRMLFFIFSAGHFSTAQSASAPLKPLIFKTKKLQWPPFRPASIFFAWMFAGLAIPTAFAAGELLPAAQNPSSSLTLSSSRISFGEVKNGISAIESITLNASGTLPLTIRSASIQGAGFSIVAGTWPQMIEAGHSLTLQLAFAPKAAGNVTGQLALDSNSPGGGTVLVALAGTGVPAPQLSVSATNLDFGSVSEGSSETISFLLASTGTSPVTVSSAKISGVGFSIEGQSLPVTLAPGQKTTIALKFLPKLAGSAAGNFIVNTNSAGSGGSMNIALGGQGMAVAHSADLSWTAPKNSPQSVVGYHIYRAIVGGTHILINSQLETQTNYVDDTVVANTTYKYEVKSVDNRGIESLTSNEITVTIP